MGDKQIMWQKYEDVIEEQLKSPTLSLIAGTMYDRERGRFHDFDDDDDDFDDDDDLPGMRLFRSNVTLSLPDHVNNEISIVSNFDCWLAHTNFQITPTIKKRLNKTEGVELMKVCGRYRFLIGIGRLFKFSDVRINIERQFTTKENIDGPTPTI